MKNPLISVIITTKNEEKNIERLLKSIERQLYKEIEIILVDHPDTLDNTNKIAKKYNCRILTRGPERSAQRNFGVRIAKGEYVFILDADMELTKGVVTSCVEIIQNSQYKALIVPEKTVGKSFMAKIRRFEREMYMGDPTIEVARFFEKKVFDEFEGYDINLTGTEDYDLPKRISKKYSIGWSKDYILHHEDQLTLKKQLQKKFYYANKSASYVRKHPDLVKIQGTILFRKAYLRHWKKFVRNPILGLSFLFVRVLETVSAVLGFIKAVGFIEFIRIFFRMIVG